MRFIYSIIRFVPDTARGEFINVGVLAGSEETGEWDIRTVSNQKRARNLDDQDALPAVWQFLNEVGRLVDNNDPNERLVVEQRLTEQWLNELWQTSNNVIQFSQPTPINAATLDDAISSLYGTFILDPTTATLSYLRKTRAVNAMRNAYVAEGLRKDIDLHEHSIVHAGDFVEQFDFAVANGAAVQLSQAWSFQIPNQAQLSQNVKAFAFTVEQIRKLGGKAITEVSRQIDIPREVDVSAVCILPVDRDTEVFREAQAAFQEAGVHLVEFGKEAQMSKEAASMLHSAHA